MEVGSMDYQSPKHLLLGGGGAGASFGVHWHA